jgi:hypothetical protein
MVCAMRSSAAFVEGAAGLKPSRNVIALSGTLRS